jgi:SAM-dependent methyltransferase
MQITKESGAAADPAFAELFDRFWAGSVAGEAALAEAEFIERVLRIPRGGLTVVAPAGCGRLALALASRGNRIHAVDGCEDAIAHARLLAARSHAAAWFSCRPGLALPSGSAFDALVCVRHGFEAPALAALLVRLAEGLRPGGRALIEQSVRAAPLPPTLRLTGIPTGAPSSSCRERALILCERV